MNAQKMTISGEIRDRTLYYPTGNEFVALPLINEGGAVETFNVLHMGCKGMLEFYGLDHAPLLAPVVMVGDQEVAFPDISWQRLEHWVPCFTAHAGSLRLRGTICAPPGHRGFVWILDIENLGQETLELRWGWHGCWAQARQTVYRSRAVRGSRAAWYDPWTDALALELLAGPAIGAFALGGGRPFSDFGWYLGPARSSAEAFLAARTGRNGPAAPSALREDNESGQPIYFAIAHSQPLGPGQRAEIELYVAVGAESDGACAALVDLQRRGARHLVEEARRWLTDRLRPVSDTVLSERLNLNLWFNYFFAAGRTVDSEELVLVTSRSPRYYVCAAFWARDAFLWSFPGALLTDSERAREMVLTGFGRYLRNPGVHSLYIDGTVLYPGFELDQLCAYVLALEQYVRATEDWGILEETGLGGAQRVFDGVAVLEQILERHRNPDRQLYRTFLSPTDDPVTHPYLTYDNAMAWRTWRALAPLKHHRGDSLGEWRANQRAAQLRETIRRHCVVDGPMGPMFAWALDDRKRAQVLDQPPGSLQLLAYYGFCEEDDPVYLNTVAWIHSPHNPDYCAGPFGGPGCTHSPHPWPLMAACDLLAGPGRDRGLKFFQRAAMDNGVACETVDRQTGRVKTGAAFASAAGFIGYALYRALARE
ncbi:MAG: glycoside hydrolase family 125 protein [Firmicutes bacterium]|nr:glycoside hydrolase family 125 protein [Bacillota bacterium]